jgi:hypothetical protein
MLRNDSVAILTQDKFERCDSSFATPFAMASNPWLAGVCVDKCPVCDVRLLNGSCIDHGPPGVENHEEQQPEAEEPHDPEEPQQQPEDKPEESQKKRRRTRTIADTDSEDTPASDKQTEQPPEGEKADEASTQVISGQLARKYRKEVKTQRGNYGNGAPLRDRVVVVRLVKLRRRNGTLYGVIRVIDKKRLDELEADIPKHITAEADRVTAMVTQVTQEVRAVGSSVASLHWDLTPVMALARGEVVLDGSMSLEQQKVAADLQQVVLTARKRVIATAMKEEKAAAKAVAKPRGRARA